VTDDARFEPASGDDAAPAPGATEVVPSLEADAQEPPETPRCPSCLSATEPGQEYCLECGARLVPREREPFALAGVTLPGLLVAAGVLLVAAGVLLAFGLYHDGADAHAGSTVTTAHRVTTTAPASGVVPVAPLDTASGVSTFTGTVPTLPSDTLTSPTTSLPTDTGVTTDEFGSTLPSTTPTVPTTTSPAGATGCADASLDDAFEDDWPQDTSSAWVAILVSKSPDTCHVRWFVDQREAVRASGITPVGVLLSDNYTSLRPGYWVLYEGPLGSREQAIAAALSLRNHGWPGAYPRLVTQ
jgi:hypothetical protein